MNVLSEEQKLSLPPSLETDNYFLHQKGIYDDPTVEVWINEQNNFAALFPQQGIDYAHYQSRRVQLGLQAYQKRKHVALSRLAKIIQEIPENGSFLEIGASSGEFLGELRRARSSLNLYAVEPDKNTLTDRSKLDGVTCFSDLEQIPSALNQFDVIGLFHVFEHIFCPEKFCSNLEQFLAPEGKIIIEVPSFDDPLRSIYNLKKYEEFYFQKQHPFVYSGASLKRTLEACGLKVVHMIPHQRYGLENHLTWLTSGRPGGDRERFEFLGDIDTSYRRSLEEHCKTDAVIAISTAAKGSDNSS